MRYYFYDTEMLIAAYNEKYQINKGSDITRTAPRC